MHTTPVTSRLRRLRAISVLLVLSLLGAACLGEDGGDTETRSVTMLGAYTDEDGNFREMLSQYAEDSGIDVQYEGSGDFETTVVSRIEGGSPPDLILFPQPGLLADLARRDQVQPLGEHFDAAELEERLQAGLIELGMVDDELYGVPLFISVKSLVWYPVQAFEDAGYQIPETWDELVALTDQIRGDGVTPWCLGIEASGSTGWVATDWIEDLVLRVAGPEAYDQWVAGELPFASPEVTQAAEMFEQIALTPDNVLGGRTGILNTPFGAAPEPMFEDPPACYLHKQASFIVGSFPEEAEFGTDYDVFYFPPAPGVGDYDGRPVMGSGDVVALATDNEAAVEAMQYLTTAESFERSRANDGGTLFAFRDFAPGDYPNDVDREQAAILEEAESFRFDGSDLMPGQIGSGAFWTEMVTWINDEQDLDTTLQNIDQAWPQ